MVHDDDGTEKVYSSQQIQFHAPSEHTINGRHYDLEMHIIHVDDKENPAAAIAIFFDRIEGGTFYNRFLA